MADLDLVRAEISAYINRRGELEYRLSRTNKNNVSELTRLRREKETHS